jgi:glycosyltransferase involved in cell wall biosynthesis
MSNPPKIRRLAIVSDAWSPQVNGVVRTLKNTKRELEAKGIRVLMITPELFSTIPCPTDDGIRLALASRRRIAEYLDEFCPDALHIATEGPLGWQARAVAVRRGWTFTTAYHTRFPEYLKLRLRIPLRWSTAILRRFHAPSSAVLVPTSSIAVSLERAGFESVRLWGRGVDQAVFFPRVHQHPANRAHPVYLYAGRLAKEKNIEAFLSLSLPGEKWVVGDGPLAKTLKRRYPEVRFTGALSQHELADIYSRADVFVFPSLTDTFGLVMVEAMSCGLPVAAFPVSGPVDVIGQSGAGSLNKDLAQACLDALEIDRSVALMRAESFTWARCTEEFVGALVPLTRPDRSAIRPELASNGAALHHSTPLKG